MRYYLVIAIITLLACNNEVTPAEKPKESIENKKPAAKQKLVSTDAGINGTTIAELDMGSYVFRVHEVIRFAPDEMQSRMMKWKDAEKDYYIIDGSIENKSGDTPDTGRDMLAAYFTLSDGSVYKNILRGASLLASYQVMNKNKYPQQQYDLIWGSKFPANGKARAHVFGVEVPEGATIKSIGFYQKNEAKKKQVDFK